MQSIYQTTLQKKIGKSGKTLFTGMTVQLDFIPAPEGTGIVFRRTDLQGNPSIQATTENVQSCTRSTKIGDQDASVQTIEHCMAALFAFGIDNLFIDVSGPELPIFDGSSKAFIELIDEAGIALQNQRKKSMTLDQPCHISDGDAYLIALPSTEFRVSYMLSYPQSPYLKSQYFSATIDSYVFRKEIAPCRTFTLYEDVEPLIKKGILKNPSLEHGVVIDGEKILNPEGVRFHDEMVRHKILDLIGDISLIGSPLQVHLIGTKTGHEANHAIAKQMLKSLRESWN